MSDRPTIELIRQYCDGELSPEQVAELEAQLDKHPASRDQVEFERTLREHVAAVLKADGSGAPPELAERILQHPAEIDTGQAEAHAVTVTGTDRRSWWSGPTRANVFAVAASLALVAGAVLFGVFGRPIDAWRGPTPAEMVFDTAIAVAEEHIASTTDIGGLVERLRTGSEAASMLIPFLPSGIFDISDLGYEFIGADLCQLPHSDHGCHLFYMRKGEKPGLVSLHIAPDRGQFSFKGEEALDSMPLPTMMVPEGAGCQKDVMVWTDGRFVYLLAVCHSGERDEIARRFHKALSARSRSDP